MITLIDATEQIIYKYVNEHKMDNVINNNYGYKKINRIDNKLRFESVRNLNTIERYFESLIDNIH